MPWQWGHSLRRRGERFASVSRIDHILFLINGCHFGNFMQRQSHLSWSSCPCIWRLQARNRRRACQINSNSPYWCEQSPGYNQTLNHIHCLWWGNSSGSHIYLPHFQTPIIPRLTNISSPTTSDIHEFSCWWQWSNVWQGLEACLQMVLQPSSLLLRGRS